jgi:hypothetical protein
MKGKLHDNRTSNRNFTIIYVRTFTHNAVNKKRFGKFAFAKKYWMMCIGLLYWSQCIFLTKVGYRYGIIVQHLNISDSYLFQCYCKVLYFRSVEFKCIKIWQHIGIKGFNIKIYWDTVVELYIFIPQLTRLNWLYYNWRIFSIHHYSPIYYPNPMADLLTLSFGD